MLGTERHESRRIDNQLRGRAGRQGDPGSSRFYLSLQDDLMRIFGGERMQNLMLRLGMEEDVPIESRLITKRIAAAQEAVEAQHFASRKHLLEYDDVMNKQRQAVYGMRRQLLEGIDQTERIKEIIQGIVASFSDIRCPEKAHTSEFDLTGLQSDVLSQFGVKIDLEELNGLLKQEIEDHINELLERRFKEKEDLIGPENMREAERVVMLNVIDNQWKDHLLSMDHLKEGIGLRGYGQKDPLIEYKKESFELFQDMMDRIEDETIRYLFFLQVAGPGAPIRTAMAAVRWAKAQARASLLRMKTKRTKKTKTTKRRWWRRIPSSAARLKARWKTSRAISSARKTRKWPSCNSSAAAAQPPRRSRPSPKRRPAATIPAPAAAAKNTRNATEPDSSRAFCFLRVRRHLAGSAGPISAQVGIRRGRTHRTAHMDEYGVEADENADYGSFQVTAWRFKDTTGAYAGFLELAPARSYPRRKLPGVVPGQMSQKSAAARRCVPPPRLARFRPDLGGLFPLEGPGSAFGTLHLGTGRSEGQCA